MRTMKGTVLPCVVVVMTTSAGYEVAPAGNGA
jgi:hypothetical protein